MEQRKLWLAAIPCFQLPEMYYVMWYNHRIEWIIKSQMANVKILFYTQGFTWEFFKLVNPSLLITTKYSQSQYLNELPLIYDHIKFHSFQGSRRKDGRRIEDDEDEGISRRLWHLLIRRLSDSLSAKLKSNFSHHFGKSSNQDTYQVSSKLSPILPTFVSNSLQKFFWQTEFCLIAPNSGKWFVS